MKKKVSTVVDESKKPLTEKQKVFVATLAKTLNPTTAEMVSGKHKDRKLAAKKASRTLEAVAPKIQELMDASGLSDEFLLDRLKRALLAKKMVWSVAQEDWLESTDWQTQVKALEIAFRLKGHLSNKQVEVDTTQEKTINVTFNLVKARSIDEIAKLTDQTSIAKGRVAVVDKPVEAEVVEPNDGKDIR